MYGLSQGYSWRAIVMLQAGDNGGGTLSGGYTADAVDKSLAHLDGALKLAPQDCGGPVCSDRLFGFLSGIIARRTSTHGIWPANMTTQAT
jgi:hypothetical protein